jgi:cobalamin-dependent methionine synthase I
MRASLPRQATARVVLATLPGERHELGLLCAGLLAASAGVGVLYLGPDLPATDILHAARTSGARVVLVALTAPGRVSQADVAALARLPPRITLWAGGPAAATITAAHRRARLVPSLRDVVPMLTRHAR